MCEILYAARKDGLKLEQLQGFFTAVVGMCRRNPHGVGFIINRKIGIKNIDEDAALKEFADVANSKTKITEIIAHARFATHGEKSTENCHPHTSANGRFVVIHNGIFSNLGSASVSDSAAFAERLSVFDGDIGEALKEAGGYWSVFVMDTKSKKLYYTRHNAQFSLGYHPETDTFYHATKLKDVAKAWSQRVFYDVFTLNKPMRLATAEIEDDVIYEVMGGIFSKVGEYVIPHVETRPLAAYTGTTAWSPAEIDEENEVGEMARAEWTRENFGDG